MLIACPECGRRVSDRAATCPDCAFPVAAAQQETMQAQAKREELTSRKLLERQVDCPICQARGFCHGMFTDDYGKTREGFSWCTFCRHSGRVALVESSAGFFAVQSSTLAAFLRGDVTLDDSTAQPSSFVHLGSQTPPPHRYPAAHGESNDSSADDGSAKPSDRDRLDQS